MAIFKNKKNFAEQDFSLKTKNYQLKTNGGGLLKVENLNFNNFKKIFVLGLFAFVFSPNIVFGGTYYVATTGNDTTGDGSSSTPWATIGKAVVDIPDSEDNTVYIATGIYDQESSVTGSLGSGYTNTFQAQGAVTVQAYASTTSYLYNLNGDGTWEFKGASTGEVKTFVVDLYNSGDGYTSDIMFFRSATVPSSSNEILFEDMEFYKGTGTTLPINDWDPYTNVTARRCYLHDFPSSYGPFRSRGGNITIESSYLENWGPFNNAINGSETKILNNTFYATDNLDYLYLSDNSANSVVTWQNNLFLYGGAVTDYWEVLYYWPDISGITTNISNNMAWKVGTLSSPRVIDNYPTIHNQANDDDIVNNLIVVDPLTVNPGTSAEISSTSLAVGRGINTGVTTGFNGVAFTSGRYDIGAWAVGDSATKQYVTTTDKTALVVGDSFCDGNVADGDGAGSDDFDEALISRSYFSDWTFVNSPGQNDSPCFSGRLLKDIIGPMGEFAQDNSPSTIFLVAGYNDFAGGELRSAAWVDNQVEAYQNVIDDLTNNQAEFIYTTQPDNGCTPVTTIADAIESGATFNISKNIERFKDDNLWSTYYSCPSYPVHPVAAGYTKMAQYAEEAYIHYYDSDINIDSGSDYGSYLSSIESALTKSLDVVYGIGAGFTLTNTTLLDNPVFINSDTEFRGCVFDSSATVSGAGTPTYTNSWRQSVDGDPLLNTSGVPLFNSPLIDTATSYVSTTTDTLGNNIYGVPDIGAYEYQPPYTVGTHDIPTTGDIRIYSDGKYRMKTASSTSATTSFFVTPASGSYLATTTQFMDITVDTWETTGDQNKQWTATSTAGTFLTHATSTIYTVGDLTANTYYTFNLDGTASTTAITGTNCTNGTCLSDANGQVVFTYSGGYSTHTFALNKDTTGPTAFTPSTPTTDTTTSGSVNISWNPSSDVSGLAKYQLYINDELKRDNILTSTNSLSSVSGFQCGSNTWYIRATDNQGNTTNSSTYNLTLNCGGGIFVSTTSGVPLTAPSILTPDVFASLGEAIQEETPTPLEPTAVSDDLPLTGQAGQVFTTSLHKGLKNNSVTNLQQFLRELGLFTYPTNTSYYGTVTEEAVQKFQCKYDIICTGTPEETGYGVVGPKTREVLNKAYSLEPKADSSGTTPTGTTGTETPSVETPSEAQQVTQLQQQISDLLKMVEELQRQLLEII